MCLDQSTADQDPLAAHQADAQIRAAKIMDDARSIFHRSSGATKIFQLLDDVHLAISEYYDRWLECRLSPEDAIDSEADDVSPPLLHASFMEWNEILWGLQSELCPGQAAPHEGPAEAATASGRRPKPSAETKRFRELLAGAAYLRAEFVHANVKTLSEEEVTAALRDGEALLESASFLSRENLTEQAYLVRLEEHRARKAMTSTDRRKESYYKANPTHRELHALYEATAIDYLSKNPGARPYSVGKYVEEKLAETDEGSTAPDVTKYIERNWIRISAKSAKAEATRRGG